MTATRPTPVQFRDQAVEAELARRGASLGKTASRDLARYYDVLARELGLVDLTPAQWGAVREAVAANPTVDLTAPAELGMAVGDWLTVSLDPPAYREGWDAASVGALLGILFAAPPARALAIVDAAERWG